LEKSWLCTSKTSSGLAHRTGSGAPGCSTVNRLLSEKEKDDVAIIHRTVRWCTGLSGESTAPAANGRPRYQRATRGPRYQRATCGPRQRSVGHTGLSGVHRTVSGAPNGPKAQRSAAPDMEGDHAPDCYSGCPVVHQTVRCTTRQKARISYQIDLQRLLAALGL
jgi:hypothetical protein